MMTLFNLLSRPRQFLIGDVGVLDLVCHTNGSLNGLGGCQSMVRLC